MIEHEGIIEHINGNHITVRILQQSACSTCHARGACMASDSKEKRVDVYDHSGLFGVNERVIIEGKESIGYKAIFWAFVVPLIILVVTLVLSISVWKLNELKSAANAIIALAPYYVMLYLLRKKMANTFRFTIRKQINL